MQENETPAAPLEEAVAPIWRGRWAKNLIWIAATAAAVYGLALADVVLRARSAYLEGEKYAYWNEHPEAKKAELESVFEKEKSGLAQKLQARSIAQEEHDRRLEAIQFDLNHRLSESSIKYAYIWYKTAYELFTPPESRWARLAREKAAKAREQWKAELKSRNIPFEEYMLD